MSTKDQNHDLNNVAITLEVDNDLIKKVRNGNVAHLSMSISEQNQNMLLENAGGILIMDVEKLPVMYHGCYFYNNGVFPYIINRSLNFLILSDGKDSCLTRIIDVDTQPGTRFRFGNDGEPSVEDPNGDSCIWQVVFEIIPVPDKPKFYLMRWNPTISSFTENDYEESVANMKNGMFRMNWSIREWEEARKGDMFFMLRTGDDKAGMVFNGQFISDPYPADDWNGSAKRRMYVDMICTNPIDPKKKPRISPAQLQKAIPSIDWQQGHSGTLLSEEEAAKLDEILS